MTNSIVTAQVTQTTAPAPETLQETGALVSQGGTTLAQNASALLTQLSDLTPLLTAPSQLASLTWSGGVATATVFSVAVGAGNTYSGSTGLVSLVVSGNVILPGQLVTVTGLMGSGSYADAIGSFVAGPGTTASVIEYTIATGLTMTITDSDGHVYAGPGLQAGDSFLTTIAGAIPSVYNGTFVAAYASATTFTYALASDGGTSPATGTITYTPRNQAELVQMATSFFAQGSLVGVYVLEMGPGEDTAAIAALSAYITANPNINYEPDETGFYYAYLVPRSWANQSTYLTLVEQYENTTAKTYFFTTMTTSNYTSFTALMKSVYGKIGAPGTILQEFSVAADFYQFLVNSPSSTNKVGQFAFRFLYGVTPYPVYGNSALLATLKAAKVNVTGTGSEGGISTALIKWGTTMDGRQATYWYSVDWIQINCDIDVANAVINGSQNGPNPLYFDQLGINQLQLTGAQTLNDAISYGLGLGGATVATPELDPDSFNAALAAGTYNGQLVINAVPFLDYVAENPDDYAASTYNGLEVVYITQNGFIAIRFNINVTDFVAAP